MPGPLFFAEDIRMVEEGIYDDGNVWFSDDSGYERRLDYTCLCVICTNNAYGLLALIMDYGKECWFYWHNHKARTKTTHA